MSLYLFIVLGLLPTLLFFSGALQRILCTRHRFVRFQMIGASFMIVANLSLWVVTDPNFGLDPMELYDWSLWFKRAENAAYFIGLLIFGCGYFLERRPRPGLTPWPIVGRIISWSSILGFGVLSIFLSRNVHLAWLDLPWPVDRLVFMLGLIPFAIGYVWMSRRPSALPDEPLLP